MTEGKNLSSTHWSVVLAAGGADSKLSRAAMEVLCEKYWPPLYSFLRRKGHPEDIAKEQVQEFFVQFLEGRYVKDVSPGKGRFRSYLLVCFKNFLANEWDRERAQKRGGHLLPLSLDEMARHEPAAHETPETAYERQWAWSLLGHALRRLKDEYARSKKETAFEALSAHLPGGTPADSYAQIGQRLGMPEGAVKVAVHRLRKKYKEILKDEVAQTLGENEDINAELRYLMSVL